MKKPKKITETKDTTKKTTVSRRAFLKGMGTGALGTAVAPRLFGGQKPSIDTKDGKVPVYSQKKIRLEINGRKHSLVVRPAETLLDVLRERLNLTGTKKMCDRGECGGCTVLLEGKPVYSCTFLAVRADGKTITTIEGLSKNGKLHPVQQAFIEKDAYQCGFCTPGTILTTVAFLGKKPRPNLEEIKQALSGHLCRCGNYSKMYEAVAEAARKMRRS